MKLNYYVSELRNSLSQDYKHLDTRMLIRLINEFRTVYIKNEYNKNKTIDPDLAQEISFVMNIQDQSTIIAVSTKDRILKSDLELPKPIKLSHRDIVLTIRSPKLLSDNYNYITKDDAVYAGNGRFNTKDIYCFLYNRYLYTKLKKENPKIGLLSTMSMLAIFEDPLDCIPFQYNEYIDPLDYEYPMTDTIWGYIKSNILNDGLGVIQANVTEERTNE